jgi:prolipoprotein diacylglyceryltransferase
MEKTIGIIIGILFALFMLWQVVKRIRNKQWQWSFLNIFLVFAVMAILGTSIYYLIF